MDDEKSGGIDQSAMSDAWFNSPVVVQDVEAPEQTVDPAANPADGLGVEEKPGIVPPNPNQPAPITPPVSKGKTPEQVSKEEAAKAELAKNAGIMEKYFSANGKINADDFLKFVSSPSSFAPNEIIPAGANAPAPAAVTPESPPAAPVPAWKKEIDEETEYVDRVEKNTSISFQIYKEARNRGMSELQAEQFMENEIGKWKREHIAEWKHNRSEAAKKAEYEERQRVGEEAEMRPAMGRNLRILAQEFIQAGAKMTPQQVVDEIVYGEKIGAPELRRVFFWQNPDAKNLGPKDKAEKMESWLPRFFSNNENVQWLGEIARMRISKNEMPKIFRQLKGNTPEKVANQKEAQMPKQKIGTPQLAVPLAENDPESWIKEGIQRKPVYV